MDNEKFYTVKEAVRVSRISQSTINNAIKKGILPAREITDSSSKGFHYLIDESDLKKWIATKRVAASEPKTLEEISAWLVAMMKEEYERGVKDGKREAREAIAEAMRGVK